MKAASFLTRDVTDCSIFPNPLLPPKSVTKFMGCPIKGSFDIEILKNKQKCKNE